MLKKKNLLFLIIAVSILALAVVGCGDNNEPAPDNNNNNNGNDNGEAVGDGSLQRVLDAGEFHVVGSGGYRPFNYFDEDGEIVGFDVDTGAAIAERLGVELNYGDTAWDGIIEGLRAGRYDAVLGSMAITDERLEVVSFTIPYYYSGAQLVVREDSGITDPSEMDGLTIGVATGTTFADDAEELGATVSYYEDDNQTLMELINGRIDGVITDRVVAIVNIDGMQGGDQLTMAGDLLRLEQMALALRQDDEELLAELNEILEEMHADGTLRAISEEWLGEDITVDQ
ncbi:ABC transporter substrate-binding protein [Dethiobacter alkaliphilus]|uniref:Extracellular solute-binding protein family 3 n=1 Tax=Dethiobacter alkaliphilus AHT 1 TaxID=555088 RepID=C0GGZ9_DETAL|nr:ABC transporter substrate-binding protein [Dethiobacter alkaliphilus]EEG77301.1 extracellular solute-binding protein family 3 [Dethiobacter alkaliphilus AHT 1]